MACKLIVTAPRLWVKPFEVVGCARSGHGSSSFAPPGNVDHDDLVRCIGPRHSAASIASDDRTVPWTRHIRCLPVSRCIRGASFMRVTTQTFFSAPQSFDIYDSRTTQKNISIKYQDIYVSRMFSNDAGAWMYLECFRTTQVHGWIQHALFSSSF